MGLERLVDLTAVGCDALGALAILVATVLALVKAGMERHLGTEVVVRAFRQRFGHGIILGLEFLVAADILRTIGHAPTLDDLAVLAVIVALRTFLSFTLEVELEGRWPWQARAKRAADDGSQQHAFEP